MTKYLEDFHAAVEEKLKQVEKNIEGLIDFVPESCVVFCPTLRNRIEVSALLVIRKGQTKHILENDEAVKALKTVSKLLSLQGIVLVAIEDSDEKDEFEKAMAVDEDFAVI